MDLAAKSAGTDAGDGYNETAGQGAYTGGDKNLTNMTLDQINALQNQMKANPANTSGATGVGRYQLSQPQIQQLAPQAGLSGSDKFSATNQDKMMQQMLKNAGIDQWRNNQVTQDQLIQTIAGQIPTMPTTTGKTTGGSVPGVSLDKEKQVLDSIKNPSATSPLEQGIQDGTIIVESGNKGYSIGKVINGSMIATGVIVDYSGTMRTNAQVMNIASAVVGQLVYVEIGGTRRIAQLIALNPSKDTATLRIADKTDLVPISVTGKASAASTQILSYGYAYGGELIAMPVTPTGETNKTVKYTGPGTPSGGLTVYGLSVMTTADTGGIKPGMAGGPVLDASGNMIGLNAANDSTGNAAKFIPT
jgi:muramidase (phage lysozyme)